MIQKRSFISYSLFSSSSSFTPSSSCSCLPLLSPPQYHHNPSHCKPQNPVLYSELNWCHSDISLSASYLTNPCIFSQQSLMTGAPQGSVLGHLVITSHGFSHHSCAEDAQLPLFFHLFTTQVTDFPSILALD